MAIHNNIHFKLLIGSTKILQKDLNHYHLVCNRYPIKAWSVFSIFGLISMMKIVNIITQCLFYTYPFLYQTAIVFSQDWNIRTALSVTCLCVRQNYMHILHICPRVGMNLADQWCKGLDKRPHVRLLHIPSMVAVGLSVGYDTCALFGWHHLFVIRWDCVIQKALWTHTRGHCQSPCTALPTGICLSLGLCKETMKESTAMHTCAGRNFRFVEVMTCGGNVKQIQSGGWFIFLWVVPQPWNSMLGLYGNFINVRIMSKMTYNANY